MSLKIILALLFFCLSFLGYSQIERPKDSITTQLTEVVIHQNKKTFSNQNGNIKLDVANSIYNSIPTALELLGKMPTVQISADKESISVVGKGNPLLYIDNQKAEINDLNILAVADIKTIEIIQNPSSKYEAEGRSVILITRKLSKKDSFQTSISQVASFKKDYNNYLGFNSSFKKNKMEWKANFNYNQLQPWEGHSINYLISDADIASDYDVEAYTKRTQFIFGGAFFYKINEDDYFSFKMNAKLQNDTFNIRTSTFNRKENVENNVLTLGDNTSIKNFVNSFFNYSRKIKAIDTSIFTGFQYSNFDQDEWSQMGNNYNNSEFELAQNRDQQFNVTVFSGRIDLEKKFKNEVKLELGGLYSEANSKSDFDIFSFETTQNTMNHYDFKEQNTAAYGQFSGKIKKVDFLGGIRIENTQVNGKFITDAVPLISKNYTNVFPKAQISFLIDSTKSIVFNYAKSIIRPNYSSLSQGATYINPYFLYTRNSNLDPTITNEIATTFQYHDQSIKVSYYQISNAVEGSFFYDNQQNIMTFKDVNYNKESGFTVELTFPFSYKFWTSTNSILLIKNKVEDDAAVFKTSKPYLYYFSNQEFKFPKEYVFALNFWGITLQKEGVFERNARFIIDMSFSKTFLKNWNCTLSYNDIFRNTIFKEQFTVNAISSKSRYLVDGNEVSIAVKYTFGKIKATEFKEKNIDDNENRVR
ncbi:outer membrane beta-barrel family protein [Flavobacterium sp. Fl-77]|uniref:Outer membrane beta-barrel family protein n=1 Tax=Flavobacterium flavipigmentatum TaxID=2893884 RepID=A0AAJ2VY71_9FLAO|nr:MULTISPECIES: outer membrane beta-barrel family protein [unclassified Flavobacterium]MDX6182731.1 outer membrane beta-barrel family protein [Flavobacterium sp. Fl-33]MDX6186090.1 outer membrane beta-barrel family protein [Flavobacterium sp. Fl-77]UFH38239.1 outer membrane beta-barrel family protein [Flavobacterium sp. F-70]